MRELKESDLPILYEQQRDPQTVQMMGFPAREWADFSAHWTRVQANPQNVLRVIDVDGDVAGSIFSWLMEEQREVGYGLGRGFWGRGIATQALRQFLTQLRERPLFGYTAMHNIASMRVLEKCGFVRAGLSKGVLNVDGQLVDEIVFRLDE